MKRKDVSRQKVPALLRRGFTLIELLVVVAIIVLVSAVMLANTNQFGGQTLLQNLAYDLALSIRQAQVYGVSVESVNGSAAITPGYGMYFKIDKPTKYKLFADTKNSSGAQIPDGVYESGEDVPPSPYTIGKGFTINKLCATDATGEDCTLSTLTILFVHPEPDAWINPTIGGGTPGCTVLDVNGDTEKCNSQYSSARIVLTSPRGDFMSVLVYANGQISVAADPTKN